MKRPLVYVFLFYVLGIASGQYLHNYVGIAFFLSFIILINFYLFNKYKWFPIIFFSLFFIFGFIQIKNTSIPKDNGLEYIADNNYNVSLNGTIKSVKNNGDSDWQTIVVQLDSYEYKNELYNTNIKIEAIVSSDEDLYKGQAIGLYGSLEKPEHKRNKGGYDEYQYLKCQSIEYKTFADITYKSEPKRTVTLKDKLIDVYNEVLPLDEAGIAIAMVTGDKTFLSDETKQLYQSTGIYHILAVSGLHIGILAFFVFSLFSFLFNKRISGSMTLIFLILYCIFTGKSVSTIRAVTMFGIVIIGEILYKTRDVVTSISFAGFLILLVQPLFLFDIGFQISFSAVFSIAILTYPIQRLANCIVMRYPKYLSILNNQFIIKYFYPSLAVFLGTTPVLAYHFGNILLYSPILNCFVIYILPLVVVFAFLVGIIGLFSINIANLLAGVCFFIFKFYDILARSFLALPFSVITSGSPPINTIFFFYIFLGIFAYTFNCNKDKFQKYLRYTCFSFFIFLFVCFTSVMLNSLYLEVEMLDVGQGDAFVVTKSNTCFVIDGGGNIQKELGENTGKNVIKPYLTYKGIDYIDGIFISHPDFDHMAGIIEILDYVEVGTIYLPEYLEQDDPLLQELYKKTDEKEIPIVYLKQGDIVKSGDIIFECISPNQHYENVNDNSMVMKMYYKDVSFLFTGDMTKELENELIYSGENLEADVLKVGHHGSKYSTSKEFIEAVNPEIGLISVGLHNTYGHPSKEVMELFNDMQIPVYSTAESGAVTIKTYGENLRIKTMLGS